MITVDDLEWYAYGNGEGCDYGETEYGYFYRNGKYSAIEVRDILDVFKYTIEDAKTDYDAKQFIVDLINGGG